MKKNYIIQLSLLFLALLIFYFTYYTREKEEELTINIKKQNKEIADSSDEKINILENIEYAGTDNRGSFFQIASELAEVYNDKPNLSYMKRVNALITLKDGRKIEISSDNAIYNRLNNDTKFMGNVLMVESDNIITSNNLDLYASKNLITIFDNIKFKSDKGLLIADKIDINLLSKEANIYMYNKENKVSVKFIN